MVRQYVSGKQQNECVISGAEENDNDSGCLIAVQVEEEVGLIFRVRGGMRLISRGETGEAQAAGL